MLFWPFKRQPPEPLSPLQVRERLLAAAASGSSRKLRALCQAYRDQVAANLDFMTQAPEGLTSDPVALDRHVQCLGAVAQCLASDCDAPELWNKLTGAPADNPLLQWERWFAQLPERVGRLEHAALIEEALAFIDRAQTLQGEAARQNEAFLQGRLGELLFHSGQVRQAEAPFRNALNLCRDLGDGEGERIHLNNLLEVHRYLGNLAEAVRVGEELIAVSGKHGLDVESLRKRVDLIRRGEPLCRVVCVRENDERELDEISQIQDGRYEFQFRRNRHSLQKAMALTSQGMELASAGKFAEALDRFHDAMAVDPYDPDPVYHSGECLLYLGVPDKAREAFEEVERLAPGWFRCRSDRWLAAALADGTVSGDEFRILRALEDGGLPANEALRIAQQVIDRHPTFAPLYLVLGDLHRDRGATDLALAAYRKGLELVAEPDLESRLLCALAGLLPRESPERGELVRRAVTLQGSLVARATLALMGLR